MSPVATKKKTVPVRKHATQSKQQAVQRKATTRKPAQKKTKVSKNGITPEARTQFLDYLVNKLEVQTLDEEELVGPQARVPFISPMTTWATTGGVKLKQTCRWYGIEGSGKSLTNLGLIHEAQRFPEVLYEMYERNSKLLEMRQGTKIARLKLKRDYAILSDRHPDPLSVLLIDAEGRFEPELAMQMGIKIGKDSCYPIFENIIEVVCEIAKEAFKQRAYDIVILDSAAACDSIEKAGKEPGEYDRGANARAWSARFNRVTRAARLNSGTFMIVDQVRTAGVEGGRPSLGGGAMGNQGPKVIPPNIRIIKHQASLAIEFDQGKKLYLDSKANLTDDYEKASDDYPHLGTKGKEPHGLEMRCKVMKNSTGRPYRNARMRFKFPAVNRDGELIQETGFDIPFELFESALEYGMITKTSQKSSHYQRLDYDKKPVGKTMHGASQVHAAIAEDEEWADEIRLRLMAMT